VSAVFDTAPLIRRREVPEHGPWPSRIHPVVQRVYAARGVLHPADAELRLQALLHPSAMGGLQAAVELLQHALAEDWRIIVVGDFDADGATGTAVAVRGLRLLGARRVGFRVPHRMLHGYGLSPALVADLLDDRPDLIVTVDNGIASHAGVAAARAAGIRVLITDHHLPGETLPAADAIVDPNLPGDGFPSKHLAGVGVMFYLLLALRAHLRELGRFGGGREPDLSLLLDLVALGTVADLVPLDRNNRILVAAGLRNLRAGRCQPGLRALAEVAGRRLEQLVATDLGFALGPRINAAGRLEDMSIGIECLLSDDPAHARTLATQLDGINAERRGLQQQMVDEGERLVMAWSRDARGPLPAGVCLLDPEWHAGVVGLVASKLKERLHRPVIAFAPAGDEAVGELRGSARSIPGFHIRDALAEVDAAHPGLIARYGGHAMAAGLSLPLAHFEAFRSAFEAVASTRLDAAALRAELWSDGELDHSDLGRELAEQLRQAGPWGQGFPEPLFDGTFEVLDWRPVGQAHLKLLLQPLAGGAPVAAIHFGGWSDAPPPARVHLAYQLELDDYRGRSGVQLLVRQRAPG
jgi:single-stranded-DNA-specific exonuclease